MLSRDLHWAFESKDINAIICASFPYLDLYLEDSKYMVGAQNVSVKGNGASTGEISAEQLNSLGVSYSIVGHSERTGVMVEPYLSKQWFVKMDSLANRVLEFQKDKDKKVHFVPSRFEKSMNHWINH